MRRKLLQRTTTNLTERNFLAKRRRDSESSETREELDSKDSYERENTTKIWRRRARGKTENPLSETPPLIPS